MSCTPRRRTVCRHASILIIAAVSLISAVMPPGVVHAQSPGFVRPQVILYDIPAQALDAALNAYIRTSGAQLLYETDLTIGRQSAEVRGDFAPDQALRILLMGTGLVAQRMDVDAVSIVPATASSGNAPVTAFARDSRFIETLQAGVIAALCTNSQTRSGSYRIAFELWIGQAGEIQASALVGSTGDPSRDANLIKALQNVRIDEPLPVGMPQPVIMAVRPRVSHASRDCGLR